MSVYILYGDNFLTGKALKNIQTQLGHPELLQAAEHSEVPVFRIRTFRIISI